MGQATQLRVELSAFLYLPFITLPLVSASVSARIFPFQTTVNALLPHLIVITAYEVNIVFTLGFKGVEIELQIAKMTCPRLHS